jgi:hypothetical protein
MTLVNGKILVLYPGGCGFERCIRPPVPGPRPVPLYGVIRPLYAAPIK